MSLDISYSGEYVPRGERIPPKVAFFGEDGEGGLATCWVCPLNTGSIITERGGGGASSLSSLASSFEFPLSAARAD